MRSHKHRQWSNMSKKPRNIEIIMTQRPTKTNQGTTTPIKQRDSILVHPRLPATSLSSAEHPSWAWTAAIGSPWQHLVSTKACWKRVFKQINKKHMYSMMRRFITLAIRLAKEFSQTHPPKAATDRALYLFSTYAACWHRLGMADGRLESMQLQFSLLRAFWYILKPWTWYSFSGSEPLYAAKPVRGHKYCGCHSNSATDAERH